MKCKHAPIKICDPCCNCSRKEIKSLLKWVSDLQFERVTYYADAARIIEWINDPKKQPAVTAFTDGPERYISYAIEKLIARVTDKWKLE